MLIEVLLRKKNVIFILPYISIVQEKIQDLMPLALEFNFLVEEYCAGKGSIPPVKRHEKNSIYICTMEKAQILFDSLFENNRLNEIGLVVVDELHMIGDAQRGPVLEILLAKIIFLQHIPIQIVGMSATISNLHEIAKFLYADIYTRDFRPIELVEKVKIDDEIFLVSPTAESRSETLKLKHCLPKDKFTDDKNKRDPDQIGILVYEVVCKQSSCLIFCATKKNCESVATLLSDVLPKAMLEDRRQGRAMLIETIKGDANGAICSVLSKTIPFGVAYHHSGKNY